MSGSKGTKKGYRIKSGSKKKRKGNKAASKCGCRGLKGHRKTNCQDNTEVHERMRLEEEKRKSQQEKRARSMKGRQHRQHHRGHQTAQENALQAQRKTSDASYSSDPTDNREHLPKSCIYARIEHHTSQAHRMHAGKPGTRHGICAVHFQKGKV